MIFSTKRVADSDMEKVRISKNNNLG